MRCRASSTSKPPSPFRTVLSLMLVAFVMVCEREGEEGERGRKDKKWERETILTIIRYCGGQPVHRCELWVCLLSLCVPPFSSSLFYLYPL